MQAVLLPLLEKMEIYTKAGVWAVFFSASSSSSCGAVCSEPGRCQGTAQSFHVQAKHSTSKVLPTACCSDNPSLLLSSLNPGCSLQGWSPPELFYRQTGGCWLRGSPGARPPPGDGFAFVQPVSGRWPGIPSYPSSFPWASLLADFSAEAEAYLHLLFFPSDVLI